jgi:transcription initiation factor TFIIIB Brf1 subunit/transcription initiation factor TFIIB
MVPENTPHSIAAGIVYFVAQICNAAISKQAVSDVSGISEVTINKCFKKLDSLKNELIPSQVLDQYTTGQTSR